jgi:hypothetical protein
MEHLGIASNFLNKTPTAQQLREMINKWHCIKLKNLCTAKETVSRTKIAY